MALLTTSTKFHHGRISHINNEPCFRRTSIICRATVERCQSVVLVLLDTRRRVPTATASPSKQFPCQVETYPTAWHTCTNNKFTIGNRHHARAVQLRLERSKVVRIDETSARREFNHKHHIGEQIHVNVQRVHRENDSTRVQVNPGANLTGFLPVCFLRTIPLRTVSLFVVVPNRRCTKYQ